LLCSSKHQIFKSHSPYLPIFALLLVCVQLALALVIHGQGHMKHGIALIVEHFNGLLGKLECYGPVQILSLQKNRELIDVSVQRKFIRSVLGAQIVARL